MRNFTKKFKKRQLICVIALLMIMFVLFGIISGENNRQDFSVTSLSSDPFNGRGSNTIGGTGFSESAAGSIGSTLSEPDDWTTTWIDFYGFNEYTSLTALLSSVSAANGNFREKNYTAIYGSNAAGTAADTPWTISNEKEFAFWARMIQLANSTASAFTAYVEKPYFKLEADIDLTGHRWMAPRFAYPATNQISSTNNRIYFDGGGFTIKNAYVNQADSSNASPYTAAPSIFGNIPLKSTIKNLQIENAFITTDSINEVSFVSQSTGIESVFDNIAVKNSVLRGYRGMNGIAANASLIKECKLENTTFISTPTAATRIKGIGAAAEFRGNKIVNTNLEVNGAVNYVFLSGIGEIRAISGYARSGEPGVWTTETEQIIEGGFFDNTVENSKISVIEGNYYAYALGIGYVSVAAPATFKGNTVKNSYVGIKTDNDIAPTTMRVHGIGYIGAGEQDIQISDNAVISSTVSAVTRQHTSYVSGMFNINVDRGAKIERCYTENTDVIARITGSTGSAYAYAAGISIGYAKLFKDCITGSGNIEARVVGGYVYAYGIGSTFGSSASWLTEGPNNRKNWENDDANIGANADATGWWDIAEENKGEYYGNKPVTEFVNCYNFSNITTQSTSTIFAAGIGAGEGFTNCVNYGNIIGNHIGGIAYGFADNADSAPGTAKGNTATRTGALHPLIIENCANFGNLIRAANNQTSYVGGIFSRYEFSRNYRKVRAENNGLINVIDNIDGLHLEITNCISDGNFYFYKPIEVGGETIYELTDDFSLVSHTNNYWGVIFGSLNMRAYKFQESNTETKSIEHEKFDEFINERFIISNTHYNEDSAFNFMESIKSGTKIYAGDNGNLSGISHILGVPASNWRQTIYGATVSSQNIRAEYLAGVDLEKNPAMTERLAFNVWSSIVRNWEDSLTSYIKYDEIISSVWNTESGIPQLPNASFPFQVLMYDGSGAEKGYVPNVSIQKYDNEPIDFFIEEYINPEIGVKIARWELGKTETYCYAGTIETIDRINDLPIIILFAKVEEIEFTIQTNSSGGYTYSGPSEAVKGQTIVIEVAHTTDGAVNGVVWSAIVGGNKFEILSDNENIIQAGTEYTYALSIEITEWFILNFADGEYFRIEAEFVVQEIIPISFEVEDIIDTDIDDISGASLSINLIVYNKNTILKIKEGSLITLTAIYDTDLYAFGNFIINGEESSNDTPSVQLTVSDEITSISFSLTPKVYDLVIQTYALASGGMKVQIDNEELIETKSEDLLKIASLNSIIDGLKVKSFYEDVDAESFYRFERWEFKIGGFISNEASLSGITLSPKLFKEGNLQGTGEERAFVVVAVFQRQVKLVVNMKNDTGYENNTYRAFQGGREILDFASYQGVIVDENILVRIEFFVDSRLEIYAINGIKATEHDDYRDKVFYITLNSFTQLEITLIPRPATILLRNHKAHDASDITSYTGLGVVALEGSTGYNLDVEYEGEFRITINRETNANLYRFIDLKIRNVITNELDSIEYLFGGSGAFTLTANENFFKNYVNIDGECEILLFVAVVYEIKISAPNFTRQNETDGTYIYNDAFGNSFTLKFEKGTPNDIIAESEPGSNNFVIDHGVKIRYTLNGEFNTYYNVNAGESEKEEKVIIITSTREIAFSANQYSLTIKKTGSADASIESYSENFGIGSVISIPFNVKSAFQINEIWINSRTLSELGVAEPRGNTLTINVTPEFIKAVNASLAPDVEFTMDIKTGLSSLILFGGGGGGLVIIVAVFLIIFLSIRSKRINIKRKAAEALAREYEQRFNIGNVIEDLRKLD